MSIETESEPARPAVEVRPATPADAEAMIVCVRHVMAEPGVGLSTDPDEFTFTPEQERELIADLARTGGGVLIVAAAGGDIVGVLSCLGGKRRAQRHVGTIGISLRKEFRGQGVGTRMMRAAIEWARGSGVVRRLELSVYAHNRAAIHVYEKVGFAVEGRRPRAAFREGQYVDDLIMGLWVG